MHDDTLVSDLVKSALDVDPGYRPTPIRPVEEGVSGPLLKAAASDAQRFVLGVAHPAGWNPKIQKGLDGHRDWMSETEVEKAAWGYLTEGQEIGLCHVDGTVGAATVVESYIYRGPDWLLKDTLGNEQIIKSGDWLIGGILEPPVWDAYRRGEFTGWSVQGSGTRRTVVR